MKKTILVVFFLFFSLTSFVIYSILKIVKNVKSLKEPANIIEKTKKTETMLSNAKDMDEALNNFIIRTKDTI